MASAAVSPAVSPAAAAVAEDTVDYAALQQSCRAAATTTCYMHPNPRTTALSVVPYKELALMCIASGADVYMRRARMALQRSMEAKQKQEAAREECAPSNTSPATGTQTRPERASWTSLCDATKDMADKPNKKHAGVFCLKVPRAARAKSDKVYVTAHALRGLKPAEFITRRYTYGVLAGCDALRPYLRDLPLQTTDWIALGASIADCAAMATQ